MAQVVIQIKDAIHSKRIQEMFFDRGYSWGNLTGGANVQFTDKKLLFFDETDMQITHSNDIGSYIGTTYDEILLVHPKQLKFLKSIIPRKLILYPNIVDEISANGYYFEKHAIYLNNLIRKKEHYTE